jgi:hypothetical protein
MRSRLHGAVLAAVPTLMLALVIVIDTAKRWH